MIRPSSASSSPDGVRLRTGRGFVALLSTFSLCVVFASPLYSQGPLRTGSDPVVGPATGTLIIAGGGELGAEIWERFVDLAGGESAKIVVIPTAAPDEDLPDDWRGLEALRAAGVSDLVLMHTRDPKQAEFESFVRPLREATGVWLPGGRPWRLVDAYLNTRVHGELFALLDRGGVVGGTSAGASIQASFLMRGDPETNRIVYSANYPQGFGFLERVAVDQHLLARGREDDLWKVLDVHPELLGIGLDEGTALIIHGDRAEVVGESQVLVYDPSSAPSLPSRFVSGTVFDLGSRKPIGVDGSVVHGNGSSMPADDF